MNTDSRSDGLPARFRYSLVIATLHDRGDLALCLESLVALEAAPSFEVLVIDQNGDDRLCDLVARFSSRLSILHLQVPFRGACRARNLGAARARGEWVGFPDDDCRFLPDTLCEVERLSSDARARVVTGLTLDDAGTPNLRHWKAGDAEFSQWTMLGRVTEPALFVRRDVFLSAGGFDERFGPGARFPSAEGFELMNRLFACMGDGKALYSERVRVKHPAKVPPWNRWVVARFYAYAVGAGGVVAKHRTPHMVLWGVRIMIGSAVQALLYRGFRGAAFAARLRGFCAGVREGARVFWFDSRQG